ncbi:TrkA family potassium uptake protein [Olsenella sp. YH-ols2217]|uniref:TrkA family potassium uptake protein n=1 Tax=Kribbibacterium absianum TaxID=3044210 RepID=A0ABT6ZHI7_9ACTN|nr:MULTISPECIES: TrkA family potassium uptake protein [unclassified Olsenella]MDJ1121021.1 TrkA family potassium uptake protein [Olsenella sp. YH-ols2216]MDJ1128512.1 TrkA family potassium uptake protein [Olsenella sp. YH-ols2217]
MSLLGPSKADFYTVIVGCGRLGSMLANDLSNAGGEVLVVDKDPGAFVRLSSGFGGLTAQGDATNIDFLTETCRLSDAFAVVIVTDDDIINIMVAQMAHEIYHVEHVITRIYDPDREGLYQELGIETICPVRHSAKRIKSMLTTSHEEGASA